MALFAITEARLAIIALWVTMTPFGLPVCRQINSEIE